MAETTTENTTLHTILLIGGGLFLGTGILNLYWSFGRAEGPLNGNFAAVGFSGLDDIRLLGPADYSIGLVVVGMLALILANATAWKKTGGY